MRKVIKYIFFIQNNFIEEYLVRIIFLLLLEFIMAFTCAVYGVYIIFLNVVLYLFAINVIYSGILIFFNAEIIRKEKKRDYLVLIVIAAYCIVNSFFYSENAIEGGHDQGTYLESAVLLAKTGSFSVNSDQKPFVYTYPAWNYYSSSVTKNIFLPGNAVFLSIFYKLFGFIGIEFANSFILFFSTSLIYIIVKKLFNWKIGLVWVLLFLFNFYTIYFSRANYVENLQLLFMWFYLFLFIRGFLSKNSIFIIYAFIPLMLLMTIRLEAFLYIPMYLFLLCVLLIKKHIRLNTYHIPLYILVFVIGLFIPFNIYVFDKSLFLSTISLISSNATVANGNQSAIPYNQQIFIWINILYSFTPIYLAFFILGVINFINQKKETKILFLLITLLILPQFIFFIRPGIAFYLPWFMRRYWGVFTPFSLISISSLIFSNLIGKSSSKLKMSTIILSLFVLIIPGLSIFLVKQGDGVMQFEKSVASLFNKQDLVIFWDYYGAENYGPPLFFYFDKNIVYDRFPAHDKKTYARMMKSYKNVYIATSIKSQDLLNHPYFQNNLYFQKHIESSPFLSIDSSCDTRIYILNPSTFKSYDQISSICSINNPPITYNSDFISLNIYKMDTGFKNKFVKDNYDPNLYVTNEVLK